MLGDDDCEAANVPGIRDGGVNVEAVDIGVTELGGDEVFVPAANVTRANIDFRPRTLNGA